MQVLRKLVVQVFGIWSQNCEKKKKKRTVRLLSRSAFQATMKVVCASLHHGSSLVCVSSCLGLGFSYNFSPNPLPLSPVALVQLDNALV